MNKPVLTNSVVDELNVSLFELSDNNNTDPHTFYTSVANLLTSAGVGMQSVEYLNLPTDENFETYPEIGTNEKGDSLFLYLAYNVGETFTSHAEIVDAKELNDIFTLPSIDDEEDVTS
jgi:hypothetical protein